MLWVIPHICGYVIANTNEKHIKQVNAIINIFFYGISYDKMNDTHDIF